MSEGTPPSDSAPAGVTALVREGSRERSDLRCETVVARRILVRADPRPFAERWSIDAYVGCAFGCRYCDATEEWRIEVRTEAPRLLEREASRWDLHARPIGIGVRGDPYPPVESRHRLTQRILEMLLRPCGLRLSLATRSTLIVRDAKLLCAAAQRSRLAVALLLPALDESLARKLDPGAPAPAARLAAVTTLVGAGVATGIRVPVLPGINDDRDSLRALLEAAARARASWASVRPISPGAALRRRVHDWVRIRLPERLDAFRALVPPPGGVDPGWRADLRATLAGLRREVGLPAAPPALERRSVQLALPGLVTPPRAA